MDVADADTDHRFPVKATADSHFAWIRTRLALERTMTSWVRTAVSLIGFGFTIVQFFQRFSAMQGVEPPVDPFAARYVGLALMGAGVLVLVVSVWQYRVTVRYMWQSYKELAGVDARQHQTPAFAIAIVMIFVGVFAFLAVATRTL